MTCGALADMEVVLRRPLVFSDELEDMAEVELVNGLRLVFLAYVKPLRNGGGS